MRKPKVGMIGVGNIAKKVYLPLLTNETEWNFVGIYTPNEIKRNKVSEQYRIQAYGSMQSLASDCDAVFVHSSTATHYDVVKYLLQKGIDVYVDKPLASTVKEAEELVALSQKLNRKLMVGFNRRFAPNYVKIKDETETIHSIKMEKHRVHSIGPEDYGFTLLDDFIHLVDTIRFLADDEIRLLTGSLALQSEQMLYQAFTLFQSKKGFPLTAHMNRQAGTNLEQVEVVTKDKLYRVKNINTLEIETANEMKTIESGSWDTILKQRGFEDAVHHFIESVMHDKPLIVDGQTAYETQILVEQIIKESSKILLE